MSHEALHSFGCGVFCLKSNIFFLCKCCVYVNVVYISGMNNGTNMKTTKLQNGSGYELTVNGNHYKLEKMIDDGGYWLISKNGNCGDSGTTKKDCLDQIANWEGLD